MQPDTVVRPYCIPPCACALGRACLRAQVWPLSCLSGASSTPGGYAPPPTPGGGANRRPGGAMKTGAPPPVRESKNPDPVRIAYETLTWQGGGESARHALALTDGTVVEWDTP